MNKKYKVVMLPTNEKTQIYRCRTGGLGYYENHTTYTVNNQGQHLNILSDDEIKEGEYWYDVVTEKIQQAKNSIFDCWREYVAKRGHAKKIIATTDQSIRDEIAKRPIEQQYSMPCISNKFIKQFCEMNGIWEVMVEYEFICPICGALNPTGNKFRCGAVNCSGVPEWKLKVNPDNTINISTIKESYSKEEVYEKLHNLMDFINHRENQVILSRPHFDNWIEDNL